MRRTFLQDVWEALDPHGDDLPYAEDALVEWLFAGADQEAPALAESDRVRIDTWTLEAIPGTAV